MTKECDFGCECDTVAEFGPFDTVLDPPDLERLIKEKMARARRYVELRDKIGVQFETD